MYISLFTISINEYHSNAYARVCLNNTFLMHREIQSMFPSKEGRRQDGDVLFRITEPDNPNSDSISIYIQSKSIPDPQKSQLFSSLSDTMKTIDMDEYYKDIQDGTVARFVLYCRPTYQHSVEGAKNSKKRLIYDQTRRKEWLLKKEDSCGFEILKFAEGQKIKYLVDKAASMGDIHVNDAKKKKPASFYIDGYSYSGILKVHDADLFKETLVKGIGTSKAHGFGLMLAFPA